jgi:hypothetical protein
VSHRLALAGGTLALTLAVATQALGQSKKGSKPGLQMGAVAGINVFTFGGSDASGTKSRTAIYAGVALRAPLSPTTFVEPQLLFFQEGARSTAVDSQLGTVEGTFKFTYLELPILLGLNLGQGGHGAHVFAGPALGLKVGCDIEASAQGLTATSPCSEAGLTLKSLDFGVTGGGGFTFPLGPGTASVDARYTLGLTAITDGSNVKNQGLSVGAGFTLPLGR